MNGYMLNDDVVGEDCHIHVIFRHQSYLGCCSSSSNKPDETYKTHTHTHTCMDTHTHTDTDRHS